MKAKLTVEKDGAGDVSIYPDEDEDMPALEIPTTRWHRGSTGTVRPCPRS
jgi:hypothetical protein